MPNCVQCNSSETLLWRTEESGEICNDCYLINTAKIKTELEDDDESMADNDSPAAKVRGVRKSTRSTRYKPKTPIIPPKAPPTPKPPAPRGRGRRSIFKRPPLKAPKATATVVTSDSVFYKGTYMQQGDIVSMTDVDGGTYYAQIRGFMTDQYCEKSAVVTWLLPTKASPPPEKGFDAATYIIGPEEELPRKLEYMEFIMHAPSDYYKASDSPYQLTDNELNNQNGFIWTSVEPKEKL